MTKDERKSRSKKQGYATIPSGNNDPQNVFNLLDDETVDIQHIRISYNNNGTVTANVELYDDKDVSGSGDVSDPFEEFIVQPGDRIIIEGHDYDNIINGVEALADGTSDDQILVSVGGKKITQ